jgi:hypothetical protein
MYVVKELNYCPTILSVTLLGVRAIRPNEFHVELEILTDKAGNVTTGLILTDGGYSDCVKIALSALLINRKMPEFSISQKCFWEDNKLVEGCIVWSTAMAIAIVDLENPRVKLFREGKLLVAELAFASFRAKGYIPLEKISDLVLPLKNSCKKGGSLGKSEN